MIKIGDGSIEIEGNDLILGLEFARICKVFADKKIMPENLMIGSVKSAFMSDDELKKETIETLDRIKKLIDNVEAFEKSDESLDKIKKAINDFEKNDKNDEDTFGDLFKDIFLGE